MAIPEQIGWGPVERNLYQILKKMERLVGLTGKVSSNTTDITDRLDALEQIRWDDLRAPASGINPVGQVSPPTVNATDGSLTFSTDDAVCIWFQLPHAWVEESDIHLHIHWSKTTSAAGTVNWQTKYKWFNIGDVAPAFSSLVGGNEAVPNSNTANKHALMSFPSIDGTGKILSSMLCVYLIRTATGDTYGADVNLYEVDVHYQIDSNGSRQEYIK